MAGNPNPSPETRFKPGNPGGGKTSEQKRLEYEAAEMAAKARHKLLSVITEKLNGLPEGEELADVDITKLLSADMLRLFKDSEDRAHGTPKQSVEHTGDAATPVQVVQHVIIDPPKRE
jgi:hypothetical protein